MSRSDEFMRDCEAAAEFLERHCQDALANGVRGLAHAYRSSRNLNSQLIRQGRRGGAGAELPPPPPLAPPPLSPRLKATTSRLLEPVAAGDGRHAWCDQCDRRVSPGEGRACTRRFCGLQAARLGQVA